MVWAWPDLCRARAAKARDRQGPDCRRVTPTARCVLIRDLHCVCQSGFQLAQEATYQGGPSPHLQFIAFHGAQATGAVHFHPAFGEDA